VLERRNQIAGLHKDPAVRADMASGRAGHRNHPGPVGRIAADVLGRTGLFVDCSREKVVGRSRLAVVESMGSVLEVGRETRRAAAEAGRILRAVAVVDCNHRNPAGVEEHRSSRR